MSTSKLLPSFYARKTVAEWAEINLESWALPYLAPALDGNVEANHRRTFEEQHHG